MVREGRLAANWVNNQIRDSYGLTVQAGRDVYLYLDASRASRPVLDTEAVSRGVIDSQGLGPLFKDAKRFLGEDPGRSAVLFGDIAEALGAAQFLGYELMVRGDQAKALEKSGDYAQAARVRTDVGWRFYWRGQSWSGLAQVRAITQYDEELSSVEVRAANGLAAAAGIEHDTKIDLADLEEVFDHQEISDQGHFDLALAMAEEMVAHRRTDLLAPRIDQLISLAEERLGEIREDSQFAAPARLLMCVCDATGEWEKLERRAREFPGGVRAWITARRARASVFTGDVRGALDLWSDAAQGAVERGMSQSAADWVFSRQVTRGKFHVFEVDNTDHLLIQALRAGDHEPSLTGVHRPELLGEQALAGMLDQRWRSTLAPLQRLLKHAVTAAHLGQEFEAHQRLGDLYANTDRWRQALAHYAWAGGKDKTKELGAMMPGEPVSLEPPADELPEWEVRSWLEFVSRNGSRLEDESARAWMIHVFELLQRIPPGNGLGTWGQCLKALPALVDASSSELARSLLDYASSRFDRPKGENHHGDEELCWSVVLIAQTHPELEEEALRVLTRALLLGDIVGRAAVDSGNQLIQRNQQLARALLGQEESEDEALLLALVDAGDRSERLRTIARRRWEHAIKPKEFTPKRMDSGTNLGETGLLVTVLETGERRRFAEAMLTRAIDERDDARNRQQALVALAIAGSGLRDEMEGVFTALVEFARGPVKTETVFDLSRDQLAFFRTTSGPPPLAAQALATASTLAFGKDQFLTLKAALIQLFRDADGPAFNRIAAALRYLPPELLAPDLRVLAVHENRDIRAAAAFLWSRAPHVWPELGEGLATDTDPYVRGALAGSLGQDPLHEPLVNRLRQDDRRDVRRALSPNLWAG